MLPGHLRAGPVLRRAALPVAAFLLVAGCGGDDSDEGPTDAQQVRATVQAYERALREGDARKACELTYLDFPPGAGRDRAQTTREVAQCANETREDLRTRPTSGYQVRSMKIRGNTATVTISAPSEAYEKPPRSRLRLRRFGSGWKIAFEPA